MGIFPSAAIAWRVTEEGFLKDNSVINNLKLRLSYGESGNNAVDNYSTIWERVALNMILMELMPMDNI